MKQPINFDKLNLSKLTISSGNAYKLNIDDTTKETTLWAFREPDDDTKYCLAFVFNWKMNWYELRRAENGAGTNWNGILHKGLIERDNMLTMSGFMVWASMLLEYYEKYYN